MYSLKLAYSMSGPLPGRDKLIVTLPVSSLITDGISFGLFHPEVKESPINKNSISSSHWSSGLLKPYLSEK